jgi:hypothetical protein
VHAPTGLLPPDAVYWIYVDGQILLTAAPQAGSMARLMRLRNNNMSSPWPITLSNGIIFWVAYPLDDNKVEFRDGKLVHIGPGLYDGVFQKIHDFVLSPGTYTVEFLLYSSEQKVVSMHFPFSIAKRQGVRIDAGKTELVAFGPAHHDSYVGPLNLKLMSVLPDIRNSVDISIWSKTLDRSIADFNSDPMVRSLRGLRQAFEKTPPAFTTAFLHLPSDLGGDRYIDITQIRLILKEMDFSYRRKSLIDYRSRLRFSENLKPFSAQLQHLERQVVGLNLALDDLQRIVTQLEAADRK